MLAYWHRSSPWSSGKKCGRRERVSVCHGCLLLAVLKRAVVLSHLKVYARVTMLSHFKAHAISIYIYTVVTVILEYNIQTTSPLRFWKQRQGRQNPH